MQSSAKIPKRGSNFWPGQISANLLFYFLIALPLYDEPLTLVSIYFSYFILQILFHQPLTCLLHWKPKKHVHAAEGASRWNDRGCGVKTASKYNNNNKYMKSLDKVATFMLLYWMGCPFLLFWNNTAKEEEV